jgi:hypothetical protein
LNYTGRAVATDRERERAEGVPGEERSARSVQSTLFTFPALSHNLLGAPDYRSPEVKKKMRENPGGDLPGA